MAFDSPGPLVRLLPLERLSAKVDLEVALALNANSGEDIVFRAREIDATKGIGEAVAIVCVEYAR